MESAGVFVLFLTLFNGSTQVDMLSQEFETFAMCKYASDELEKLYTIERARVYATCLPKEEK